MIWLDNHDWSYVGGKTPARVKKRTRQRAAWLREALLELGPTFIKVGQLISTRADILPTESVEELSKLQDKVPAFGFEQVRRTIETELGKPLETLFPHFDPTPIAAASLGQVHRAQLVTGADVVVKVQRPGLIRLFEVDLAILRRIATYFQSHPRYGRGRDWVGIYEECGRILHLEADYLNEGRNADTFRRNFRDRPNIAAPRIYWRFTSRRVLTLEYLPGIKISNYEALTAAGLDPKALARLGAESYLEQLLNHGFFHADPHPGNLAVTTEGTLIFYDFGMMGHIQPLTREKLLAVFFGVARRDANAVIQALVDLGALELTGDPGPIRRSVQYLLDNFMEGSGAQGTGDRPISVAAISDDLYEVAYDQPFRFPATFTFVMRALSTLEGIGRGLDPNFNFLEIAKPYAVMLMDNSKNSGPLSSVLLGELGRQAAQAGNSAFALPRRIEETIAKLESGDLRLRVRSQETDRILRRQNVIAQSAVYGLVGSAFLLSATLLLVFGWTILAAIAGIVALFWFGSMVRLIARTERIH
jgi:predicted unusual protein kinase regulating ubiquinone biosynthesis (AarF/ABC1/UbiB family)